MERKSETFAMTKFTSYMRRAPPVGLDLATTDQAAAKAFYVDLFGWDFEDNPMDETGDDLLLDGHDGRRLCRRHVRAAGGSESWRASRAPLDDPHRRGRRGRHRSARARVSAAPFGAPPFDVFDAGRIMSIISDPTGAYVALWQAKRHIGAGVKSEPNTIHWCELLTNDPDAVTAFYTELLGMDSETMTMDQEGDYTIFLSGGAGVAGTMAMPEHLRERGVPSHWSVYFQVADLDAVVAQAGLPTAPTWVCLRRTSPWWDASPTCWTRRARDSGSRSRNRRSGARGPELNRLSAATCDRRVPAETGWSGPDQDRGAAALGYEATAARNQ